MKLRIGVLLLALCLMTGCGSRTAAENGVAATTGPVAQFAQAIVAGTGVTVAQVITDSVSCLHDYSLSVGQMEAIARSRVVLISGAGLEAFMEDAIAGAAALVDCSQGVDLLEGGEGPDPHIWLDPDRAARMAENIVQGLSASYPDKADAFRANGDALIQRLRDLKAYGQSQLSALSCRELITFHDGFGYLADAFDLEILAAMEEESGSEVSARDLTALIQLAEAHQLPAVFTEVNGSASAASILQAETGAVSASLDMAMGGTDYFEAMTRNIDTLKEALQ